MSDIKYSPKIPFILDENNDFLSIKDSAENIKQKFKILLFTNQGEKIMNPRFGIGIKKFLFNQSSSELTVTRTTDGQFNYLETNFKDVLREQIEVQTSIFLPDITIDDIQITTEDNTANVQIYYSYGAAIQDYLEFSINN